MGAVAVERSAAAGRRRRGGVRVGRAVVGETVVAVGRTASVRVVVARSDAHASVMMEVLARLVQRETLHPQIELLMTPRTVRRCENQKTAIDVGWPHGMERDGWTQSEHNKTQRTAADGSIVHTSHALYHLVFL